MTSFSVLKVSNGEQRKLLAFSNLKFENIFE